MFSEPAEKYSIVVPVYDAVFIQINPQKSFARPRFSQPISDEFTKVKIIHAAAVVEISHTIRLKTNSAQLHHIAKTTVFCTVRYQGFVVCIKNQVWLVRHTISINHTRSPVAAGSVLKVVIVDIGNGGYACTVDSELNYSAGNKRADVCNFSFNPAYYIIYIDRVRKYTPSNMLSFTYNNGSGGWSAPERLVAAQISSSVGLAFDYEGNPVISYADLTGNMWIAYDPVPEPATITMLLAGACFALVRRSKR